MTVRNPRDLACGFLFIACGLAISWISRDYRLGVASNIGPGFFPFFLGVILMLIGGTVALTAFSRRADAREAGAPRPGLRTLVWVLGPVVLFGLLLETLGLALSVIMLAGLSSTASHDFGWKGALVNTLFLVVFVVSVFVYGLRLQFGVWPAFLAG